MRDFQVHLPVLLWAAENEVGPVKLGQIVDQERTDFWKNMPPLDALSFTSGDGRLVGSTMANLRRLLEDKNYARAYVDSLYARRLPSGLARQRALFESAITALHGPLNRSSTKKAEYWLDRMEDVRFRIILTHRLRDVMRHGSGLRHVEGALLYPHNYFVFNRKTSKKDIGLGRFFPDELTAEERLQPETEELFASEFLRRLEASIRHAIKHKGELMGHRGLPR